MNLTPADKHLHQLPYSTHTRKEIQPLIPERTLPLRIEPADTLTGRACPDDDQGRLRVVPAPAAHIRLRDVHNIAVALRLWEVG